jgi:lipopolysaccharide export system permease protein
VAFYLLWIVYDLFDNLPDFLQYNAGPAQIMQFYLVQMPKIAPMVLPIAFLFAVLYVLLYLSRYGEIIAIQSAGISLWRVSIPFFLISFLLSGVLYFFYMDLTPDAAISRKALEQEIRHEGRPEQVYNGIVYRNPETKTVWYIQEVNLDKQTINNAEVLFLNSRNQDHEKWFIREGHYNAAQQFWDLKDVKRIVFQTDGKISPPRYLAQVDATWLKEEPYQLVSYLRSPDQMNWNDLNKFLDRAYLFSPTRVAPYWTENQYRWAYPLICPILCFYAFALGIGHSRRNTAASLFNCIAVLFGILIWINLAVALGNAGRIPAFVAAWSGIFLFGTFGLYLFGDRVGWWWMIHEKWIASNEEKPKLTV